MKPALGPLARLARQVDGHLYPRRGISSEFLNNFLTMVCGEEEEFAGVASIDQLPRLRRTVAPRHRYQLVINLGDRTSGSLDGHFVALVVTPSLVYYTDPFGLPPPPDRRLTAFLRACGRPVRVSKIQLQDFRSVYCGLFTMLLVWHANAGRPFPLRLPRRPRGDFLKNDQWCMRMLRRLSRL